MQALIWVKYLSNGVPGDKNRALGITGRWHNGSDTNNSVFSLLCHSMTSLPELWAGHLYQPGVVEVIILMQSSHPTQLQVDSWLIKSTERDMCTFRWQCLCDQLPGHQRCRNIFTHKVIACLQLNPIIINGLLYMHTLNQSMLSSLDWQAVRVLCAHSHSGFTVTNYKLLTWL